MSRLRSRRYDVGLLAIAAAAGGAFSGSHPTGTHVVDSLETAIFAAAFCLLCSRSSRAVWIVVGVVDVVMARSWLLLPAGATELVAIGAALRVRSRGTAGALVGAIGVQVILRWPESLFHGFPSIVAAALTLVCAVSSRSRVSERTRRRVVRVLIGVIGAGVIASVPLAVAALVARHAITEGEQAAKVALADVGDGSQSSVAAQLGQAEKDASYASSMLGAWWTAPARLVPVAAQQGRLLSSAVTTAAQTSAVGKQHIAAIDYKNLEYHDGQLNLDRLRAIATPGRIVDRQLHRALEALQNAGSGWVLGPIESKASAYQNELARATHTADLAVQAIDVLPAILGGDGTRHYLIAFMSPSESRGYDGFIGSYGVLTADDGHVTLTQSGPTSDLDASLPLFGATLRGVPQYLARYGLFHPGMHARDATYSPDFPTDADVFTQIYEQTGGVHIDGVLGIDPYGLAAILHLTGPIEVPGLPEPLTSSNAATVLLKTQYTTFDSGETNQDLVRHDFLQQALHEVFDALVAGDLPSPHELSAILDPEVVKGRISFWSFHSNEQPLLGRLGMGGSFPSAQRGDLLAVTTQNAGNNKIDAFLHKSIDDRVRFDAATGNESSTVTIKLVNDAPSFGLPGIVIDNPGAGSTAPGINVTWLTLYSPLQFSRVTIDGARASMRVGTELGVYAYSQFVDVPPKGTVTLKVYLTGRIEPGPYRLTVRLQPSANAQRNRVEVGPIGGAATQQWTIGPKMVQSRVFASTAG